MKDAAGKKKGNDQKTKGQKERKEMAKGKNRKARKEKKIKERMGH
jgi:hypothetical protein